MTRSIELAGDRLAMREFMDFHGPDAPGILGARRERLLQQEGQLVGALYQARRSAEMAKWQLQGLRAERRELEARLGLR